MYSDDNSSRMYRKQSLCDLPNAKLFCTITLLEFFRVSVWIHTRTRIRCVSFFLRWRVCNVSGCRWTIFALIRASREVQWSGRVLAAVSLLSCGVGFLLGAHRSCLGDLLMHSVDWCCDFPHYVFLMRSFLYCAFYNIVWSDNLFFFAAIQVCISLLDFFINR